MRIIQKAYARRVENADKTRENRSEPEENGK
jgi:hypothetical protein